MAKQIKSMIPQKKVYTIKDNYKLFRERYPSKKLRMNYKKYRMIYTEYIDRISEGLLMGREFNMGNKLSTLRLVKMPANHKISLLDFQKTKDEKKRKIEAGEPLEDENGYKTYRVIKTDDTYFYFYWNKKNSRAGGKSLYRITPSLKLNSRRRIAMRNEINLLNIKNISDVNNSN